MKPEQVRQEGVLAAWNGWAASNQDGMHAEAMAHALAAVAPLIAAAERERCAQVAHQHGYDLTNLDERNGAFSAAATIRVLP